MGRAPSRRATWAPRSFAACFSPRALSLHSEPYASVSPFFLRTTGRDDRANFLHEIEAVAGMPEHPNVVRYFRGWQEEGHFWLQMEFCDGGSLRRLLSRRPKAVRRNCPDCSRHCSKDPFSPSHPGILVAAPPDPLAAPPPAPLLTARAQTLLPERDVWQLVYDVASALAHCHAHGVLHLDIKPDNIYIVLVTTGALLEPLYKLGDFGNALLQGHGWSAEEGDGGCVGAREAHGGAQPAPAALSAGVAAAACPRLPVLGLARASLATPAH